MLYIVLVGIYTEVRCVNAFCTCAFTKKMLQNNIATTNKPRLAVLVVIRVKIVWFMARGIGIVLHIIRVRKSGKKL